MTKSTFRCDAEAGPASTDLRKPVGFLDFFFQTAKVKERNVYALRQRMKDIHRSSYVANATNGARFTTHSL